MTKELREALKELVFDTVCIGLPKDSAIVGDNLLSPARKKLLEENIGTYIDEAEEKFIALFNRYAAEREKQARNNEAGNIYKIGMDIVMKRPASAVVAGGTDLDKFLNELERKYGKDLIQWVYGDHNSAALKETTNE